MAEKTSVKTPQNKICEIKKFISEFAAAVALKLRPGIYYWILEDAWATIFQFLSNC